MGAEVCSRTSRQENREAPAPTPSPEAKRKKLGLNLVTARLRGLKEECGPVIAAEESTLMLWR